MLAKVKNDTRQDWYIDLTTLVVDLKSPSVWPTTIDLKLKYPYQVLQLGMLCCALVHSVQINTLLLYLHARNKKEEEIPVKTL